MVRTDRRRWLALTLVLSLLFTQWLGIAHAVAHSSGSGTPEYRPLVLKTSGVVDHQKSSGACTALDAATLGAGITSSAFAPALPVLADDPAAAPLAAGRDRLFIAHFSSRAPPLND